MRLEILEGTLEIEDVGEFLKLCRDLPAVVQPVSAEVVLSRRQIEFAVKKAVESFKRGENVSRNLSTEILLYTVAKRNISKAIEYGVKKGLNRLVFVIYGEDEEVEKTLGALRKLIRGEKTIGRFVEIETLKKIFEITDEEIEVVEEERIEDLVLERIALFHVFK